MKASTTSPFDSSADCSSLSVKYPLLSLSIISYKFSALDFPTGVASDTNMSDFFAVLLSGEKSKWERDIDSESSIWLKTVEAYRTDFSDTISSLRTSGTARREYCHRVRYGIRLAAWRALITATSAMPTGSLLVPFVVLLQTDALVY